jgi:serine O-acetyltransferase
MDTVLEVVLYAKGYASLVAHRAAFRLWQSGKQFTALYLQSQTSAMFGLDIHPCAQIGIEVMFDHGTGIVIGETATIGDGSTLLHGVTLGGTGKDHGDRHPKVGRNVLIGAGCSILGNIQIGHNAKIGAGSVVLRPIPPFATAVGAPARIIGRAMPRQASDIDNILENFKPLHMTESMKENERRMSFMVGQPPPLDFDEPQEEEEPDCPLCPWKKYFEMAKFAPPGSVTLYSIRRLLDPKGCSMEQIGNIFFELDTEAVGHVTIPDFRHKGLDAIQNNTKLSLQTIQEILNDFFQKYESHSLRKSMLASGAQRESIQKAISDLKAIGEAE